MTPLQPSTPRAATRHLITSGLVALPLLASAQPAAQSLPPASTPAPPQRVEIRSDGTAQRRADLAGRQVVARDELLRHGDTRLVEALQRLPGVTVESRGSATELKLGGLGDGYTQLLLNGEPLPRGVALDSIALDSIERVEIVRGATVQSAQTIAGSINLVTRRPATPSAREFKLQAASQWGRPQASATLNLGDRVGNATWGLGLVLSSEHQLWPATTVQERRDGAGSTLAQRTRTDKREHDRTDSISLNPRLAWKREDPSGGISGGRGFWQFSTDHSLRLADSSGGVADWRAPLLGPPPAQQRSTMALNYQRLFWRGRLQVLRREADGTQTEARLNVTHARRDQQARAEGFDFTPRPVQDTAVDGRAVDQSAVFSLNHQRPVGPSHRLDLGAEWEQARRQEDRVQTEQDLPGGLPVLNLDERFDTRVQRGAVYAQDDWTLAEHTAVQVGVRVEQLRTLSQGNEVDTVRQQHRLVGPVLRLSTRPGAGPGTFKLGLSRGFKLPAPRDVMPRRYVPIEVSPTAPAQSGNPELRPERAWSLDASWQDDWPAQGGDWVLSASLRRMEDVILDRLTNQPGVLNAPWLLQRFNSGRAWSAGLELELRGRLRHAWVAAAPLRWQASMGLTRSRLDDVDAERPALAGQAPWHVKLDLTQPLATGWTAQLGMEARGPARADLPSGRRIETETRRSLNAGLSWQPRPHQTWRVSVAQIAATDHVDLKTVRVVQDGEPVVYRSREAWHRDLLWRVGLDSRF